VVERDRYREDLEEAEAIIKALLDQSMFGTEMGVYRSAVELEAVIANRNATAFLARVALGMEPLAK
jgi:hypothetical protein